jgi:ABC-type spermidine/putrescine transport system permease subunit I
MRTVAMIFVCTVLSIAIGFPIGIVMARSNRVQRVINPVLDVMQTMPSFVYLIPVVILLGIGRVPVLIAVVIYAIPPMIRLTDLGIRLVDKDVLEAADAFGATDTQKLFKVQLPQNIGADAVRKTPAQRGSQAAGGSGAPGEGTAHTPGPAKAILTCGHCRARTRRACRPQRHLHQPPLYDR